MKTFNVTCGKTPYGPFSAANEQDAIDQVARQCGYANEADYRAAEAYARDVVGLDWKIAVFDAKEIH